MFGLGFETKEKKWRRETCRQFAFHPANQQHTADPPCRASYHGCHSAGEDAWPQVPPPGHAGEGRRGIQHPSPLSHAPNLSVAKDGTTLTANAGAVKGALWDQLIPAKLPWLPRAQAAPAGAGAAQDKAQLPRLPPTAGHLGPTTAEPTAHHGTACFIPQNSFKTPHSTTNQAQLPCDRTHTTVMGQLQFECHELLTPGGKKE